MPKSTILVVDKEKMLVDLLTRALFSDEVAAVGTTSAEEALKLVDVHAPALVVVDPTVAGGFALIDAVLRKKSKVVAVSGSPEITESLKKEGVTDIVDRNAGFETLIAAIRRLLEAPVRVMGRDDSVHVLVTDDEDEIRNVLFEFLITKGYNVKTGKNGFDAVKIVNEDPALQVVLLDVSMPEMGGMEALQYIMERDNPPSVIMMTAVADREIARQAMKTGAFDYILKPFDFASIDASIMACLSHKEFQKQPWWKRLTRRSS